MNKKFIQAIGAKDWKNIPPQYDNITDTRTVEWGIVQELIEIRDKCAALAELADNLNILLVGGLQQGSIKDWGTIAQLLYQFRETVEQEVGKISIRF